MALSDWWYILSEIGNIEGGRGRIVLGGAMMSSVLNEFAVEVELSSSQLVMCLVLIKNIWATVSVCKSKACGHRSEWWL